MDASDVHTAPRDRASDKRARQTPEGSEGEGEESAPAHARIKPNPAEESVVEGKIPCRGSWAEWAAREMIPLFVTAGRGMGGFVQRELGMLNATPGVGRNRSCFSRFSPDAKTSSALCVAAGHIKVTDGKIFFTLPLSSSANLVRVVGQLMCAERAFIWSDQSHRTPPPCCSMECTLFTTPVARASSPGPALTPFSYSFHQPLRTQGCPQRLLLGRGERHQQASHGGICGVDAAPRARGELRPVLRGM